MFSFLKSVVFSLSLGLLIFPSLEANAESPSMQIAKRIWQNECAGSTQGLVSWNKGEEFPSLGIGHFIWYPKNVRGNFQESFPAFVQFAQSKGVQVPPYFRGAAPWPNRQQFLSAETKGGLADQMRRWLMDHINVQADFLISRSFQALPRIKAASRQPELISQRYQAVAYTKNGMYALIDYVNFKGEGVNPSERYKGQGWGLLQVLENMKGNPTGQGAVQEFSRSAKEVLTRRVANSPAERGERRWLQGWLNRCSTYSQPF